MLILLHAIALGQSATCVKVTRLAINILLLVPLRNINAI